MPELIYKNLLFTGQIAKILHVSKKAVLNWISHQELPAHTTLGGHYRVWPGDLNNFIKTRGIKVPLQYTETRFKTVVAIGYGNEQIRALRGTVVSNSIKNELLDAHTPGRGLLLIGQSNPALVLINWDALNLPWSVVDSITAWQKENGGQLGINSDNEAGLATLKAQARGNRGSFVASSFTELLEQVPRML